MNEQIQVNNQDTLLTKLRSRFKCSRFVLTIEPLVFLYTISVGLNEVIRSNVIIEKMCRSKLNYTSEICSDLNNNTIAQEEVQKHVADYETVYSASAFGPRILFALLAGAWSDRNGRRWIIGLPIIGQFFTCLTYLINYVFLVEIPWQFLYLEFVNEVCGTYVAYYLGVYSYITDVTSDEIRTVRLSIIDGVDYISTSVGTFSSGPLFLHLGYYAVFGCSAIMCLIAIAYLSLGVKESLPPQENSTDSLDPLQNQQLRQAMPNYGAAECQLKTKEHTTLRQEFTKCRCFLRPMDFLEGLKTVAKPREGHKRLVILLGVVNFICYIFNYNGTEGTHRYSYARYKYDWTEQQFTRYITGYRIAYLVTLWLILPMMTRLLNIRDASIAILACLLTCIGLVLPSVTQSPVWFTTGSFISMLVPVTTITTRAIISKSVGVDEVGRIYSVLSLVSAASGSLIEAAYQGLYSATFQSFPGAYLLVNAGLLLLTIGPNILILFYT